MKNEYNVLFVYILQAHSNDWKIGEFSHIDQPKSLVERQKLALKFRDDFKLTLPIYLDDMNNTFNKTFGSWPHKSYIFSASPMRLEYIEKVIAVDYKTITDKLIEHITEQL